MLPTAAFCLWLGGMGRQPSVNCSEPNQIQTEAGNVASVCQDLKFPSSNPLNTVLLCVRGDEGGGMVVCERTDDCLIVETGYGFGQNGAEYWSINRFLERRNA
jgi:hypothetical protein